MLLESLELLLKEGLKKYNWSEEQLLRVKQRLENRTTTEIITLSARDDLVSVLEDFVKKGGNLHFVIDECSEKVNLLNIAAEGEALNVINYLLDNNIFTVDQRVYENSRTPFYSAVAWNNIEAAKLLLKRGADINAEFKDRRVETALDEVFYARYYLSNEVDYMEMAKFLVRHGVQIPDNINMVDSLMQRCPTKRIIKDFLLSIKKLENLYLYHSDQDSDFINAYNALSLEIQEISDVRVSRYRLSKLAEFIEKKFSKESAIGYKEHAALREYSSLPKYKKKILENYLAQKNFNSDDLIKVYNYIKDHFFEIACIAKDLTGSAFEAIAKAEIIGEITQYFQFVDSSTKIAGVSSGDIDCNHS